MNLDSLYPDNKPEIGMGCTVCYLSDSEPATIIDIKGKRITVQFDIAELVSGSAQNGTAEYTFTKNENGPIRVFSLRKNGKYIEQGSNCGPSLSIGHRRKYYDPHF